MLKIIAPKDCVDQTFLVLWLKNTKTELSKLELKPVRTRTKLYETVMLSNECSLLPQIKADYKDFNDAYGGDREIYFGRSLIYCYGNVDNTNFCVSTFKMRLIHPMFVFGKKMKNKGKYNLFLLVIGKV